MGYGHSWSAFGDLPDAFLVSVRQVVAHVGWTLDDVIRDGARVLIVSPPGYVLMELGNEPGSCATGGGLTDTVVVAVLALASHFGLTTVRSDGDRFDWEDRVAWAREVTGLDVAVPKTIREPQYAPGFDDEVIDDDIPF